MKLINRDTDYAIRALNYIAQRENKIVSVSEIAQELKIVRPFLRKILQVLQKNGLLKSYEGRNGGFSLAVPEERIFLADLIRIFQGPVKLTDCLFKKRICQDIRYCLLKRKIDEIEEIVTERLKSVTIATLSANPNSKKA